MQVLLLPEPIELFLADLQFLQLPGPEREFSDQNLEVLAYVFKMV